MKNVICPVCGSNGQKKSYTAKEMYYGLRNQFQYLECQECGVLFLLNVPKNIEDFYPKNYHCHSVKDQHFNLKNYLVRIRDRSTLTKKGIFGKVLSSFKGSPEIYSTLSEMNLTVDSRILDVGCGSGDLLRELHHMGFKNLTGIDPHLPQDLANTEVGFMLQKITLPELEGKYDVVMLHHSLEHMENHRKVFHYISKLLNPNGYVCVRIPLTNSTAWREYHTDWFQLDAPRHVVLHSEESFSNLAVECGFHVEKVVYDATALQFSRSELYKMDVSSQEFWDKYGGDINRVFESQKISEWERKAKHVNSNKLGDQAAFFLSLQAS